MLRRVATTLVLSVPLAIMAVSPSFAQSSVVPRAERVPSPGQSVAGGGDGSALTVNPANLTFLPGLDLRWMWVRTGSESESSARGHSISLAGAWPFGLATGIRLDLIRPPSGALSPYDSPYTWFTWGLSAGSKDASLGMTVAHVYSSDKQVDGPTSVTLGWTVRPMRFLSLAAVAHDANAPRTSAGAHIDRSYALGAAIRPLGSDVLELGIEDRYYADRDGVAGSPWVPRATLGLMVPYVGRVRGEVSWPERLTPHRRDYVAMAMLDLVVGHVTMSGGGVFGTGVGGRGGAGSIAGAAITSWREPGVPLPARAVRIRVEDTPGTRGHVHLLQKLWSMSLDREIAVVVLHLKTEPASSLAHAYELGDAVQLLRSRGKKVVCHLEAEGGRALHVCSQADRIVINPAGGIRFAGIRSQHTYLAGLLDKLGVHAEFVRIGSYKSAPEQYARQTASAPAREEYEQNLREVEAEMIADIARGRRLDPGSLRAAVTTGPFTAPEALRARLVDGYAFDDELRTVASELVGGSVNLTDDVEHYADTTFGQRPNVAIVYLDGNMVDGNSRNIPLFDLRMAGSHTIAKALRTAREDPLVRAVVLRIESPGGSSMAADVIWREVDLTAREKPLVVSMGTVAASGGYYAAVAAKQIFVTPYTTTGSIGIFYGKADIAQLMTKIGVSVETIKTAPHADAESIYRPFTDEERVVLGAKVKQFYDVFVDRVSRGRHMRPEQVDAVARGRVWMGRQALAHHLVDTIGGLRQALDVARSLGGLPDDSPVLELPVPESALLELLAAAAGGSLNQESTAAVLPAQLVTMMRPLAPFLVYAPDRPMALLEVAETP